MAKKRRTVTTAPNPYIKDRIESHQERILRWNDELPNDWSQIYSELHLETIGSNTEITDHDEGIIETNNIHEEFKESSDDTHYLWVLEPEDLEELTVKEVQIVWDERESLCGSKEAAAEALAILEVAMGITPVYQGWQKYIDRDEVKDLPLEYLERILQSEKELEEESLDDFNTISEEMVYSLSYDELLDAWNRRPYSFVSIEAACQTLALLRMKSGIVQNSTVEGLLNHTEIENLKDYLPSHNESISNVKHSFEEDYFGGRVYQQREMLVREGQQNFRKKVLDNYFGKCCVTGTNTSSILEAAHIMPYSGLKSNRVDNGLCLRIDIHKLFDRFLLSINPDTRIILLSEVISHDPSYNFLQGKRIDEGKIQAAINFLHVHYTTFCKRERTYPSTSDIYGL